MTCHWLVEPVVARFSSKFETVVSRNKAMAFCCIFGRERSSSAQDTEVNGDVQSLKQYSYKELKTATDGFSAIHKIGEGGFGPVYKGRLRDGTDVAIKVLSSESKQGAREFLTEITIISGVLHENLVKLRGCCIEENRRMIIYEYLENNSLGQTLLGVGGSNLQFNWKARTKICIGLARGLAFLHEGTKPPILHRDIKASNILLDSHLNPKISDFGLAKLLPPNTSHVSTRVAGTMGYLAPEYALRGQATKKSDVYSFGVLLIEIVTGRPNTIMKLPVEHRFLIERAWNSFERNELVELVDTSLAGDFDVEEASMFLKVGLLCTQGSLKLRPSMSTVVKMLMGQRDVNMLRIDKPGMLSDFYNQTSTDEISASANTNFSTPCTSKETSQGDFTRSMTEN